MKLLADEGIDKPIVDMLKQTGFDVHYILETNPGANDELILSISNLEERILLTQDKDFGELVYRLHSSHSGVILTYPIGGTFSRYKSRNRKQDAI